MEQFPIVVVLISNFCRFQRLEDVLKLSLHARGTCARMACTEWTLGIRIICVYQFLQHSDTVCWRYLSFLYAELLYGVLRKPGDPV
ncbi:unnamed protein product (plasmid) [Klebsiella pneumoniae]|nr:unnamed protein product [Klebsiella pneumoniae]